MVSQNDYTKKSGFNIEVSTPCQLPYQRICSLNNKGENIVKQGNASWKNSYRPTTRRVKSTCISNNQQMKKDSNKCLLDPCCNGPRDSCHMLTGGKCSRASTICISPPKKHSNYKCLVDPCCDGPQNSCHMPTHAKCSGSSTLYIHPPKKDSKICCLDPHCIGSRNSCHMPTYPKRSKASCGLGGRSRIKRNNGTKLGNMDLSSMSHCLVHHRKRMEPMKEELESNPCHRQFQSVGNNHTKSLHDEKHGHVFLNERKRNSPFRHCTDISEFSKGCLNEISKAGTLSEAKDHRNMYMIHTEIKSSSMKGKDIEIANEGHEESTKLHHSSSKEMDSNDPVKNFDRSFQESSQIGVVKNHSTLTTTKDIKNDHIYVVSHKFSTTLFNL